MPWLTKPLDGTPRRVVSLNPSITEFLFVSGLGDRVVGRDVFSYRPRDALKAPHVGSFIDVDVEKVRALSPDLIILYYPVQSALIDAVAQIAPVAVIETPTSVDDVVATFKFVSRLLDADEVGEYIAGVYRDLLRGSPLAEGVLALFYLGGYDVACSESFTASALEAAGLRYIRGLHCVYNFLGSEEKAAALLERLDPHLLIYEGKGRMYRESELAWIKRLRCTACARGRVLVTPNDTLAHYGPSLPLDMALVRNAVMRGAGFVDGTSSVVRPSLSDGWYRPYL
ncbi:ABC transporter substrate-binding protein [Thermoproteus tenax]|uniref:ABC transporter substrate-binding protein n=1 Tax=Thermoproteus tenax TaxID=2271 RepID=UPI000699E675|nr:ABC transporter substrate-binding protein [Thermoproteus tenax]